jgi:hypothetical protein
MKVSLLLVLYSVSAWSKCLPADQEDYLLESLPPATVADVVIFKDTPATFAMWGVSVLQLKDGPIFITGGEKKSYQMMFSSPQDPKPLLKELMSYLVNHNGGFIAYSESEVIAAELLKQITDKGEYRLKPLVDCSFIDAFPFPRYSPSDIKLIRQTVCF